MKILLLNPPFKTQYGRFSRTSRSPAITKSGAIYYPFWLAYATGVLEKAGHEVKLIDSCAYRLDKKKTYKIAREFKPKLIVLDTSTPSIYNDVEIGAELKEILPESFVVLVGTHPTALPEETLNLNPKIDAIARYEYDYTLLHLAKVLENSNFRREDLVEVDGLSFRLGEEIIHNPDRSLIKNLDELPFMTKVYRDHLDIHKYFFSTSDYPEIQIITGRGCPHRCFFCVYPQTFHKHKYRPRSPENVVDELEFIVENFPDVREIGIEDDTFTANKNRTCKICNLILERKLKIKWYCNARVELDLETMRLMKEAGCELLIPGFESGVQEILDNIKKGIKIQQIEEFVENARKAGLLIHACFMLGNPGETKKTMEYTLDFAKKLNCDTSQFFPLIVYPGTEAYRWALENNYLRTQDFSKWLTKKGNYNYLIDQPGLPAEEVFKFCERANREYYLRARYIAYKLKEVISKPSQFRRTVKSFTKFTKYLIQGAK